MLALPATVGGAIEYACEGDFGAILTCDDAVVNEGLNIREPFLSLLKRNSAVPPDLRTRGVDVSAWTYSASSVPHQCVGG